MLLFFFALETIFWFSGGFTRSMCTMSVKNCPTCTLDDMILVAKGDQRSSWELH